MVSQNTKKKHIRLPRTGWLVTGTQSKSAQANLFPKERFKSAQRRVGQSPLKRLEWLVLFARGDHDRMVRNLAKGFQGLHSELAYEMAYFAGISDPRLFAGDPQMAIAAAAEVDRGLRALALTELRLDPRGLALSPEAEREHQSRKGGVGRWEIKLFGGITCTLDRGTPRELDKSGNLSGRLDSYITAESPLDAFMLGVKEVVEAEGLRLRICAVLDCSRLFVKKKHALYCSRKCAKAEALRAWRARHRDKVRERARADYKRRVSRRSGRAAAEHVRHRDANRSEGIRKKPGLEEVPK